MVVGIANICGRLITPFWVLGLLFWCRLGGIFCLCNFVAIFGMFVALLDEIVASLNFVAIFELIVALLDGIVTFFIEFVASFREIVAFLNFVAFLGLIVALFIKFDYSSSFSKTFSAPISNQ